MNFMKPTDGARKALSSFSWITANKILNLVIGMFMSVAVARYLGVRNIGTYSYVISLSSMIGSFANVGINNIALKRYSADGENHGKNTTIIWVLTGLGGFTCFLVALIYTFLFIPVPETRVYMLISMVPYLFTPLQSVESWLLAKSQAKHVTLVQSGVHMLCLLVKLLLIQIKAPLVWFIAITAAEIVLVQAGLCILTRNGRFSFPKPTRATRRDYLSTLKVCIPFMLSAIAITIYMRIDQVIVGNILGEYELGLYSTAVKLAEYWYFVPAAIFTAALPILTRIRERDNKDFLEKLQMLADMMTLLSCGVAIVITVFSRQILWIFGEEYVAAGGVLSLYIWAGVPVSLGYVRAIYCNIHEFSICEFVASVVGMAVNVAGNLILIPIMGMYGSVVATLITQFLSSVLITVLFERTRRELFLTQIKALFPFVRLVKYAGKYLRGGQKDGAI